MPEETFLASPKAFTEKSGALTIRMRDATPRRILDLQANRTEVFACAFDRNSIGDGTPAMMAASLDLPVVLAPEADWPEGVLETLTDYFLYGPVLRVPIEPLATLSTSIAEMNGKSLWHAYGEILGRSFYVDAEGRVTLSERWARAGRFFGTVRESLEALQASDLWQELATYRRRTFASTSACATCRHHPWCGGFWLADGSEPSQCEIWQACMDRLVEAWRANRDAPRPEAD